MTEKMKFTPTISLGNLISIIGFVVGGVGLIYAQSIQIERVNGEVMVLEARLEALESDVSQNLKTIQEDIKAIEKLILELVSER